MRKKFKNSKEIITWLNKVFRDYRIKEDQKMLTQFMKEIESGGIQSDEVRKWWLNRY
ncbi:hypothetical protein JYT76_01940 [Olleya sp. AH-315-F22]|jgi:hypothetical protein|nr:hypothetical protein [Olleya sp. AH-315-F22]